MQYLFLFLNIHHVCASCGLFSSNKVVCILFYIPFENFSFTWGHQLLLAKTKNFDQNIVLKAEQREFFIMTGDLHS